MYILAKSNGNIISVSPSNKSYIEVIKSLQNNFTEKLYGTNNEEICLKVLNSTDYKAIIENEIIIGVEKTIIQRMEKPVIIPEPTIDERIAGIEEVLLNLL